MVASLQYLPDEQDEQVHAYEMPRVAYEAQLPFLFNTQGSTSKPLNNKVKGQCARKLGLISPLLWLPIRGTEEVEGRALVDSGAPLNLISADLLKTLPHQSLMEFQVDLCKITGKKGDLSQWYTVCVLGRKAFL